MQDNGQDLFNLENRVAIVTGTGGTGVLGGAMARGLAQNGARVAVLGRRSEKAERVAEDIEGQGGQAMALPADVLDREQLEEVRDSVLKRWGRIDFLVNAAGGNVPEATLDDQAGIFDLHQAGFGRVLDLNFLGTLLPSQIFGETMVKASAGSRRG